MSEKKVTTAERFPTGLAWAMLIFCGILSLILNIWHAARAKDGADTINFTLALIGGIGPVGTAALVSHVAVHPAVDWVMRTGVWIIFAGAIALSVDAQHAMMQSIFGYRLAWAYPLVLDLATVVGLNLIIKAHGFKRAALAAAAEAERRAEAERLEEDRRRVERAAKRPLSTPSPDRQTAPSRTPSGGPSLTPLGAGAAGAGSPSRGAPLPALPGQGQNGSRTVMTVGEIVTDIVAKAATEFPQRPGAETIKNSYPVGYKKACEVREELKRLYPDEKRWPPLRAVPGEKESGVA